MEKASTILDPIETSEIQDRNYSPIHMLEYIVHAETEQDRINRISYCESIPNITDPDLKEFRSRIAYMYDYHNKVYQSKNFSEELIIARMPHYKNLLGKARINVAVERFKQHPAISPAFNGSGCNII